MKKFIALSLSCVMLFALTACGGSSSGSATPTAAPTDSGNEPTVITAKMATGGQDTLPSYASALDVINDLKTDSNIDIEYFGARQLGDDAEILQQVMAGTVQLGGGATSAFSTYTGLLDAFVVPFLLNNYDKERQAVQTDEAQAIFDTIEQTMGIKILAVYDSGMRHLANNVRPITSLEDLKGVKMRVVPSDLLIDSFNALGANPTNLAYSELYTGLQNGTIDGEEVNVTSIYSEKHYEVLKYFTEIGIYPFTTAIYCNAAWFNSLDSASQEAIQSAFTNGYNYLFDNYLPTAEEAGYKAMEDAGVQVTKIEDVTPFQEAVSGVIQNYKDKDPLMKAFIEMAEGLQ